MARKPKNRPETVLSVAPVRTKEQIDQEYTNLAAQRGDLEYRLLNMPLQIQVLQARMARLCHEADQLPVQNKPKETA